MHTEGTRLFQPEPFMEKLGNDTELARELLGAYLEDGPERLGQLEKALEDGRTEDAVGYAHSLKGMVGVLRQPGLSDFTLQMEKTCRAGDSDKAKALLPGLKKIMGQVNSEIRDFLRTLPVVL